MIYSHQTAVVVLGVVIFLFENLRDKRSVPLINSQALHMLKILAVHWLKITRLGLITHMYVNIH